MKTNRLLPIAGLAALVLSGCSIFGGNDDEELDKAGRIDMVLGEETLEADPTMATVAVILPDTRDTAAWPQAGRLPSKSVGHVRAATDFEIAWRRDAGAGTTRSVALTASPVASETHVFVLDAEQTVRAFDIETGRQQWSREIKSGSGRDKRSFGGGVGYNDGALIVASGYGSVSKLDSATGEMVWTRDLTTPMTGSPTIKDGRIYVTSQNNEIFALDYVDGATVWSDQAIAEPARVLGSPSPAAVEDFIVAPFSSGEVIAYLASNGRRLWSDALTRGGRFTPISAINDVSSRPVLSRGLAFAASHSGVLAAIDGRSGSRVWALPFGSVQAPALAGEFLFVSGLDGTVACITARDGKVVWATHLDAFEKMEKKKNRIAYAGPIVASNRVIVVSSSGEVIALSPQTGEELDRLELKDDVFLEPIAAQGRLFILTDDAELIALR